LSLRTNCGELNAREIKDKDEQMARLREMAAAEAAIEKLEAIARAQAVNTLKNTNVEDIVRNQFKAHYYENVAFRKNFQSD
jgi:RPA family protein